MNTIAQIIETAREKGASDIHISEGLPLRFRIQGRLMKMEEDTQPEETRQAILSVLSEHNRTLFEKGEDIDIAIQTEDGNRQRVNIFRQQGKVAATIRLLNNHIPTLEELKLPDVLRQLAEQPRGLVLVTGPTGSGKSTTLAAMINYINERRTEHIVTIEDPIEYVYKENQSIIHQREVGIDTKGFAPALRSVLREDPDVILVGEMRDYETISAALTAAETGHLVMSTLHTTGAAQTIDRIIDACPSESQNQIRTQLSAILNGVVTQCLIPTQDQQRRVAATEVLIGTDAVCNLIRENKCHQLNTVMQSGAAHGMHTLNTDLARLVRTGIITKENAKKYTNDVHDLTQYL